MITITLIGTGRLSFNFMNEILKNDSLHFVKMTDHIQIELLESVRARIPIEQHQETSYDTPNYSVITLAIGL